MNLTIARTAFFIISSAIYPLLVYVIVPWVNSFTDFRSGSDSAGAGMASTLAFYGGCFYSFIIWFILSILLGHLFVRAWWLSIVTLVVGGVAIFAIEQYKKYRDDNRLYPYEKHYDNGAIRESGANIGTWSYDEKHGKITTYYPDGAIESIETYDHGKKYGPTEGYYPDGKLIAKGRFKGHKWDDGEAIGIPDGVWVYYHKSGRLDDERTYAEGKLLTSKNFKLYFDTIQLVRTIADGKPYTGKLEKEGIVSKYLFANLYTTHVKNGLFDGDYTSYYTIGDELVVGCTATLINGKRNGPYKLYHTNGQLTREMIYVDGTLEGDCIYYYTDSVASRQHGNIEYICNYKNGDPHGTAIWYHKNGQIEQKADFIMGKRQGVSYKYSAEGTLLESYTYRDGDKNGAYSKYNTDGSYETGTYENDEMVYCEQYRADSTLESIRQWKDDECIRNDRYDEQGKMI